MECNHDAAPALDSLLFFTGTLPKSGDNSDGKYAYLCQKQVFDGPKGEICGNSVWSFTHVKRKGCHQCRGKENCIRFEHKEFHREIDGPPRDTAMSRAFQCAEQCASTKAI